MRNNDFFKQEDETLINVCSLNKNNFILLEGIDWDIIIKESLNQSVFLTLFNFANQRKGEIESEVFRKIINKAVKSVALNDKLYNAEKELTNAFNGEINYVILKGSSSAAYYDYPEIRMVGDIDILIDIMSVPKALEIMKGLSYAELKTDTNHHIVFIKDNVQVELHYKIAGLDDINLSDSLKSIISNIKDNSVTKSPFGYEILVPEDKAQAVILLVHMRHHFYVEGLGLRHLCDWAYFVDKTANSAFWQELLPNLNKSGLLGFAKAFTKTCSVYLGSNLPEWAKDFSDQFCEDIIKEVFLSGNFGTKNETYPNSNVLMTDNTGKGRIKRLFKSFHQGIVGNYPFVKKWFILYPFLAIYKILKYIVQVMLGKRSSLMKLKRSAKRREKLIKNIESIK